jgi:anti-sigma regulatory factor (Ser/Thr protein kinase)
MSPACRPVALRTAFPPDLRYLGAARRFVRSAFVDDARAQTADVMTLLASELFTNAVVHAGSTVCLAVEDIGHAIRVMVGDDCDAAPEVGDLQSEATSGRGLAVVDAFARDWGWHRSSAGGKTVWFEVGLP